MRGRSGLSVLLAVVVTFGCAVAARAQVGITAAQLSGIVQDKSGGAVAKATITLTEIDTNRTYTATSDVSGYYVLPNLPPGHYELKVAYTGFAPYLQKGIVLSVGQTGTVNVTLEIRAVGQQVVVTGAVQAIEPTRTEVSHVINDKAISSLASAIKLARAGLREPEKPIGSYLFSGPTGVGKTEVARQLAYCMGIELIRFDMSEYMERHAVSRLIGAPPGYVGYEEGGQLTEAVRRRPYSVVLFDEIEKAGPEVFNVSLQIMDDGRLTDGQGRVVDFKNTILIMTSNIGSQFILETGTANWEQVETKVLELLRQHFKPEFLNRVDDTIIFRPLSEADLAKIVSSRPMPAPSPGLNTVPRWRTMISPPVTV